MGGPSKFNNRLPELLKLVRKNATCEAIGAHFQVSYEVGRLLRNKVKSTVSKKRWKPNKNQKKYTFPEAVKELGLSKERIEEIVKKNGIKLGLREGSKVTRVLTRAQMDQIAKDPLAADMATCRFCGNLFPNHSLKKIHSNCRSKTCMALYHKERYNERYKGPLDPSRLQHQPKKIWEKLSATPAPKPVDWITCNVFQKISGLTKMQISHLVRLKVIRSKPDKTKVHPVTKRPIRWYALHEAALIAEVVNSEGP